MPENDCSGPHFFLGDHIPDVIALVNIQAPYSDDLEVLDDAACSNKCTSTIEATDSNQISIGRVQAAVSTANDTSRRDICTNLMLDPDGGNTAMMVEHENQRKRRMSPYDDYSEELEWKTTAHFQSRWLEEIRTHQLELIPLDAFESNKVWIEYLFNSAEPKKSTYRCRLCHKYFDEFKIRPQYKSSIADEEGMLRFDKKLNRFAITSHANSSSHTTVIEKLQLRSAKR